jgi:rSAM/selenodomain-associated transferase 1
MATMTPEPRQARRTLGLFAKRPIPGQVKTRLAAATSADWSARVAEAFLFDMMDRLANIPARRVLAYAPVDAGPWFTDSAQGRFELVAQKEGDLGRRLGGFLADELACGTEAVVVVGSDSPTLPAALIERAFDELRAADVVLGPAHDGGYYLIGCGRRLPPVFEEISWGSSRVLAETVERLNDPAWRLALLPPWYDVDTLENWWMMRGHLAAMRRAGIDPGAPRTESLSQALTVV